MKFIDNRIIVEYGFKIRLKKDFGSLDKDGNYVKPNLSTKVYLPKTCDESSLDYYEEIDIRDIDLHALSWEKKVREMAAEDEAHRKAYEDALKELESSSNSEDTIEEE